MTGRERLWESRGEDMMIIGECEPGLKAACENSMQKYQQ